MNEVQMRFITNPIILQLATKCLIIETSYLWIHFIDRFTLHKMYRTNSVISGKIYEVTGQKIFLI